MPRPSKPMGQTQEEITSFQETKFHQDFVYRTNQSLQSHSQALIGLSLTYEKNRSLTAKEFKDLQINFENYQKTITEITNNHCSDLSDKICETVSIAEDLHFKINDIYENYARLDDVASVQLTLEDRCDSLEKDQKIHAAYVDSSLMILKGHLNAQLDDLRHLVDMPDLGHQQCEISLQIKRNEDAITIKGLQIEIERLKKQCDYNQKQFEFVVDELKKLKDSK